MAARDGAPPRACVSVDLGAIEEQTRCAVCMDTITNCRTVMGCLHRFCADCIERSLRQANMECPKCRKHIQSRRSLREDKLFDSLIEALHGPRKQEESDDVAAPTSVLRAQRNHFLLEVAKQRKESEKIRKRLAAKDRKRARITLNPFLLSSILPREGVHRPLDDDIADRGDLYGVEPRNSVPSVHTSVPVAQNSPPIVQEDRLTIRFLPKDLQQKHTLASSVFSIPKGWTIKLLKSFLYSKLRDGNTNFPHASEVQIYASSAAAGAGCDEADGTRIVDLMARLKGYGDGQLFYGYGVGKPLIPPSSSLFGRPQGAQGSSLKLNQFGLGLPTFKFTGGGRPYM